MNKAVNALLALTMCTGTVLAESSSNDGSDEPGFVPPPTEKKSTLSNVSRNERKVKKQLMKMRNEMEEMKAIHEKKVEYLKQKLGRKKNLSPPSRA